MILRKELQEVRELSQTDIGRDTTTGKDPEVGAPPLQEGPTSPLPARCGSRRFLGTPWVRNPIPGASEELIFS